MFPTLAGAEPRLQRRYDGLVLSQLSSAHRLAAGVHSLPALASGFATTQAAWRFFSNPRITLPELCAPLIEHARNTCVECDRWMLVVLDWSNLHYSHSSKNDRVELGNAIDLGYDMLTALALDDRSGRPIAPVCLELRAADGLHTTRSSKVIKPESQLDQLEPVMDHVESMSLGREAVFIIDREADSIAHYRSWDQGGKKFIVRADNERKVMHDGSEKRLDIVAKEMSSELKLTRRVQYKGRIADQFVGETSVILTRPAWQHRIDKRTGKPKHKRIHGEPLALRLIVSALRDANGKRLARWLLLSNLPSTTSTSSMNESTSSPSTDESVSSTTSSSIESTSSSSSSSSSSMNESSTIDLVSSATIALWYYWRWRIESYHKLLKSAGHHIEEWQQESARSVSRRLLVTAMTLCLTWQIARDDSPEAEKLKETLTRLSGRQMKRGKNARNFTEPALLAGLCILIPMLVLLETTSLEELKSQTKNLQTLLQNLGERRGFV